MAMSSGLTKKLQSWTRIVAVLVAATFVAAGIAEILLRVAGIGYAIFDRPDPVFGSVLIAGAKGWQQSEGHIYIRVNSDGFRDRERSTAKPPGTVRIAVLGDSFTEARQVDLEATFCEVLERELRERGPPGDRTIEVLNFGISGYGTTQQLLTLQRRVWAYEPDVVLLAFYTGNDISDNSRVLSSAVTGPYHDYTDKGLVFDGSFVETEVFQARQGWAMRSAYFALQYSRFLQLLNHARLMWEISARAAGSGFAGPSEPGMTKALYRETLDPAWADAWRVTEALLARMNREVAGRGLRFLVVSLSSGIQVHPHATYRRAFMDEGAIDDLFYPDRRIEALGETEGFPVLLLGPTLQAHAERDGVFFHGFEPMLGWGHWNEEGHALAGRLIAEWVSRELGEPWQGTPARAAMVESEPAGDGGSD